MEETKKTNHLVLLEVIPLWALVMGAPRAPKEAHQSGAYNASIWSSFVFFR